MSTWTRFNEENVSDRECSYSSVTDDYSLLYSFHSSVTGTTGGNGDKLDSQISN